MIFTWITFKQDSASIKSIKAMHLRKVLNDDGTYLFSCDDLIQYKYMTIFYVEVSGGMVWQIKQAQELM